MAWQLIKADEFNGLAGTLPDSALWSFDTGGHGFGNNELQYFTDRPENCRMDGQGNLILEARKETFQTNPYTSAKIWTRGKYSFTYGALEARVKLGFTSGLWPAFWTMGANWSGKAYDIPPDQFAWPKPGEVDGYEQFGYEAGKVYGTLFHQSGSYDQSSYTLSNNAKFADAFHVFRTEWTPTDFTWFVDGQLYKTVQKWPDWPYDKPQFIIFSLSVGGNRPGTPNPSAVFPQQMLIDYVRVYQGTTDLPPPPPGGSMILNAVDYLAKSGNWNTSGTDLYAWDTKPTDLRWVEYTVSGLYDRVTVTAKNHGGLPTPPGYAFQLDVAVDGVKQGTLLVPGSQTDQTGSLAVLVTPGSHTVRLTWKNDAYQPGTYDANLRLRMVVFDTGAPPPPPPPPPVVDGKAEATEKLKALGWSDAAVAAVINPA